MKLEAGDKCNRCGTEKHSRGWVLFELEAEGDDPNTLILLCGSCRKLDERQTVSRKWHRDRFTRNLGIFYRALKDAHV